MTRRQLLADSSLIFVALIWGATFVMVQDAVREWPVFAFLSLRFGVATLAFLPWLLWQKLRQPSAPSMTPGRFGSGPAGRAWSVLPSIVIGLALATGYAFQTGGLMYTTPAKAGFITGLSAVIVPVGAAMFLKQPANGSTVLGVLLATLGLGLLTLNRDLTVGFGDLLVFGCAICFAAQILLVGRYASQSSAVRLATLQVATVTVATFIMSLLIEVPRGIPPMTWNVLFAAVFTGLLATAMAFGFQASAQRFTTATHTALIFSLEPVFAALFSYLLIGEQLTGRLLVGCGLILAGMLSAELGSLGLDAWRRVRAQRAMRRVRAGADAD